MVSKTDSRLIYIYSDSITDLECIFQVEVYEFDGGINFAWTESAEEEKC